MEDDDFLSFLRFDLRFPTTNEIGLWETDQEHVWESELPVVWESELPVWKERSISQIPDVDTNMNPISYMLECDGDEREVGGPNFSLPRNEIDGGTVHLRETVHPEPHQEVCAEMGVAALECDQWNSMTSDFSYSSPVTINGASSTTEREGGPSFSSASNEINREKVPLCETLRPHQYVYAEGGTEGTTESTLRIEASDGKHIHPRSTSDSEVWKSGVHYRSLGPSCSTNQCLLESFNIISTKTSSIYEDAQPELFPWPPGAPFSISTHAWNRPLDLLLGTVSEPPEHDRPRSLDVLVGAVSEPPEEVTRADRQPIDPTPLRNYPCQESTSFVGDLIGTVVKDIEDRAVASRHGTGAESALLALEKVEGKVSSKKRRALPLPSLRDAEESFGATFGSLKTGLEELFVGAQGQQHQLQDMLELINAGVSMVDRLGNTITWISEKLRKVMNDLKRRDLVVGRVLQDCASSISAIIPSKLKEHREKFISIDLLMGSFLDLGSGRIHHGGSGHWNGG